MFILLLLIVVLSPFYVAVLYAFKPATEITANRLAFSKNPTLENFHNVIFENELFGIGFKNSIINTIPTVLILMGFTSTATAVFGVYYKLQSFAIMPAIGMNNAQIPIIAYNYGAQRKSRILKTMKLAMVSMQIFLTLVTLVFLFAPGLLLSMFDASENMLAIGVPALRTMGLNFFICGICICSGAVFQALGNGVYSLITSVMRQLVVLIPVAWLMSLTGNIELVWISFPLAEIMSLAASLFFLRRIFRQKITPMPDGE